MLVKTVKAHGNSHGEQYWKAPGDEYDARGDGAGLVEQGLAEEVKPGKAAAKGAAAAGAKGGAAQ